jgi:hypothetical protein
MMSLAAELGPSAASGVSVFSFIPAGVARSRTGGAPSSAPTWTAQQAMPGYQGRIPAEDCAAALAYSITRAADLHGSGITLGQAFRQMRWPFPKPETAPTEDWDRIKEQVSQVIFGYIGAGFPEPLVPLVPIGRSETGLGGT